MQDRIWFAQMLRGMASLSVVYAHLCVSFWANPKFIATIAHTIPIDEKFNPVTINIYSAFLATGLNLPAFGVALFFIISGFVIPMSLDRASPKSFLISRCFRIYPIVIASLLFAYGTMYAYNSYHGTPLQLPLKSLLINMSLLREFLGGPIIEYAIWTLEIEVKFYILCAGIVAVSSLKNAKLLMFLAAVFTGFNLVASVVKGNYWVLKGLYVITTNLPLLTYMFIGICFYNLYRKHWKSQTFFACVAGLFLLHWLSAEYSLNTNERGLASSYLYAVAAFGLAYRFQNYLPYIKPLDWLAKVSYPLYMLHATLGYTLQTVFYDIFHSVYPSMLLTLVIVLIVSYVFHKLIEQPGIALGKQINNRTRSERPGLMNAPAPIKD